MPKTPYSLRCRAVLAFRRNRVASASDNLNPATDIPESIPDFDRFQSHVTDQLLFLDEDNQHDVPLPSLPFLHKLLDAFLSCEHEFKNLLLQNPTVVSKSPVDKLLSDLLVRTVKALDICNELTDTLHTVKHWNRHADIAASALSGVSTPSRGHVNRAKRALLKLCQEQQPENNIASSKSAWCILAKHHRSDSDSLQSLTRSWSAGRQLQAMSDNLVSPRGGFEVASMAVYTMSCVLVLTMWALVAAFRPASLSTITMPVVAVVGRQVAAWGPVMARVVEKMKGGGMRLGEVLGVERCGREVMEGLEGTGMEAAKDLGLKSRELEEGVEVLERRLREVFHRVVLSREEVSKCLEHSNTLTAAVTVTTTPPTSITAV